MIYHRRCRRCSVECLHFDVPRCLGDVDNPRSNPLNSLCVVYIECAVQVLITAVLLLAWMGPIRDEYHILEYFAGKARVARSARKMDLKAAALDLSYGDSGAFDMTSAESHLQVRHA